MKTYVTFGQVHTHSVNGKTLDKDTVAVIEAPDYPACRELIKEYFGTTYCTDYPEEYFTLDMMKYYPKGLVYL